MKKILLIITLVAPVMQMTAMTTAEMAKIAAGLPKISINTKSNSNSGVLLGYREISTGNLIRTSHPMIFLDPSEEARYVPIYAR